MSEQFGQCMEQTTGSQAKSGYRDGIEVREYWNHQRQESELVIEMQTLTSPRRTTRGQKVHLLKKLRERRDLLDAMIKDGEAELAAADARARVARGPSSL